MAFFPSYPGWGYKPTKRAGRSVIVLKTRSSLRIINYVNALFRDPDSCCLLSVCLDRSASGSGLTWVFCIKANSCLKTAIPSSSIECALLIPFLVAVELFLYSRVLAFHAIRQRIAPGSGKHHERESPRPATMKNWSSTSLRSADFAC